MIYINFPSLGTADRQYVEVTLLSELSGNGAGWAYELEFFDVGGCAIVLGLSTESAGFAPTGMLRD